MLTSREVATARGAARLHELGPARAKGLLVLGHGAGGGVDAPDLQVSAQAAVDLGWRVVLVEQPWRLQGRRLAEAPARLDAAWTEVVQDLPGAPRVLGGRSAGARVACRTAAELGASAVLALAFPLLPPGSTRSRAGELEAVTVPTLVVQGTRDVFGIPEPAADREIVLIAGADHSFAVRRVDGRSRQEVLADVGAAVRSLLQQLT